MTQYNIDPTIPQQFHVKRNLPLFFPEEELKFIYADMKRQVGVELFSLLEQMTSPVVVDIGETLPSLEELKMSSAGYGELALEIVVHLTPVRHRDVLYQNVIMESFNHIIKPKTFIEKVKFVFGK